MAGCQHVFAVERTGNFAKLRGLRGHVRAENAAHYRKYSLFSSVRPRMSSPPPASRALRSSLCVCVHARVCVFVCVWHIGRKWALPLRTRSRSARTAM